MVGRSRSLAKGACLKLDPNSRTRILRRYTNLADLIYILNTKRLVLRDPSSWDDGNDRYFLERYRKQTQLKTLRALCFTEARERYHHWKVFAPGPCGVSIAFDGGALLDAAKNMPDFLGQSVQYLTLKQSAAMHPGPKELPFLKRYPYRDEKEFRMIVASGESLDDEVCGIKIPPNCVRRITLSPWLPARLDSEIVKLLRSINGCQGISIAQSSLIKNKDWREFGRRVVNPG